MAITVRETPEQTQKKEERASKGQPSHWLDDKATHFHNPWPSWRYVTPVDMASMITKSATSIPTIPKNVAELIPIRKPTWGLSPSGESSVDDRDKIKTTWLGHACFLVELPLRAESQASRGARVLFDPVFSNRCSPFQWIGPKRFTPAPCKIEEIPDVDIIVISHNHYDHLDTHTIRTLFERPRPPHIFAPLGNLAYFRSLGIPERHTHILDWWEDRRVEVDIPNRDTTGTEKSTQTSKLAFDVTCTPGQHFTGRGILDRFKSLWASWVVEEVVPPPSSSSSPSTAPAAAAAKGVKVFFAGDTGYRSVQDGQDEDKVPTCPVFKEIGEHFGGFDFAMIPIGAYLPRSFMSPIHCAPQDSVRLFKDVRAKKAVGMHWGTWVLTTEDVTDPPKRLVEECKKIGIEDGAFTVCDIGETLVV